ncbi:cytochrome P450 [Mycena olivaceomarginata]|nr:cytochrome P450 [Mycena olivaceomarginata]
MYPPARAGYIYMWVQLWVYCGYRFGLCQEMAAGTAETSFLSNLLEEGKPRKLLDQVGRRFRYRLGAVARLFHTLNNGESILNSLQTAAQLEAFFLAMSLYPDIQAAAQRELDQVVGNDRLPDIQTVFSYPVPHRTREDYIYDRGGDLEPLLIPKDSVIIPNVWKMAHNPERYTNPMEFNPKRFIATDSKEAEQDPAEICFGYGRRICAGKESSRREISDST